MNRRYTRQVRVGDVLLGGGAPIAVQSMLSSPSASPEKNIQEAQQLQAAGCDILRVSVPTLEDVRLIIALKQAVHIPIVADIHFDYRIALKAVEAGVDKIRLNPGNIGGTDKVKQVAAACKERGVPVRIGVNAGSLEKDILAKHVSPKPESIVESAEKHIRLLQDADFNDIVVSLKSSHVPTTIEAYRLLAGRCDYPLHIGVTEAGTLRAGLVKNALGIGSLLMQGIGDTLRVSLTADAVQEVYAGFDILRAAGIAVQRPEIISCPTCGRTNIPVAEVAAQLEQRLQGLRVPIKVAVMGCVVNGIGEGREADIGIAGGVDSAVLFIRGEQVRTLHGNYVEELYQEIMRIIDNGFD